MARSKGRTGRPWRRARARVLATQDHCWLCGKPVDKQLRWPHPLSPSVDHRVPLVAGGPPRDPANLALSHLRCNTSKGARLGPRRPRPATTLDW